MYSKDLNPERKIYAHMVKIERISLGKQGLTKFFSPNEARIMELLWARQKMTSPGLQKELNDLSLGCIAGTLDRLVKSGFVRREIDKAGARVRYLYFPTTDKKTAGIKISEKVMGAIVDTFGESAIDSFGKTKTGRKQK
jgi:predicted transcriptional regulator